MLDSLAVSEEREGITRAVRAEFQRHEFDVHVENRPSMAQGDKGVVVPGCAICKTRIHATEQFVAHLEGKVCAAIERS